MRSRLNSGVTFTPEKTLGPVGDLQIDTPVTQSIGALVKDTDTLDAIMEASVIAQKKFSVLTQTQVDKIFSRAAMRATQSRLHLARLAVEEGGIGNVEDKTLKNQLAAEMTFAQYKETKTCGEVESDQVAGHRVVAEPLGVLAGIVPCTNPTSTTIFKSLLALKTRNTIVFSPHPRTARCTIAAAKLCRDAAIEAGAPADCIAWIDVPSVALCSELMKHKRTTMIVATGAGALVKAAYSSGKPAMGGGAGNTPVLIDETADLSMAVNSVLLSKTFDNGVICASEQAIVCHKDVEEKVRDEFVKRGAYFLDDEEKKLVGDFLLNDNGALNPAAVGQPAWKVAELAGCKEIPRGVRLLIADIKEVGPAEKFSHEKLCPCLGFIVEPTYEAQLDTALKFIEYGGMGHTSVLYTDVHAPKEILDARRTAFQNKMPTGRILVAQPTSHGAIGVAGNARAVFSLSLGCGSWGSNATAEGLQVKHLLNYKTVSERRPHILWFKTPQQIYFNRGIMQEALKDLQAQGLKRALIVTDDRVKSLGFVKQLTDCLEHVNIEHDVFTEVTPVPTTESIAAAVHHLSVYHPDCLIAMGGGSSMDAAKIMRMKYEHPDIHLSSYSTRFADIRARVVPFPKLGSKIRRVVCIPTTSGTGAEMTPFAIFHDSKLNFAFPITDYSLTPDMAIIDADLVQSMPKNLAVAGGFHTLSHAFESYVSMLSSEFTRGSSLNAARLVMGSLRDSAVEADPQAREQCHNAASIAAMAVANAFVGVTEALATQLFSRFDIKLGLAHAMVMSQVVKFNAEDAPSKQGTFPQYTQPIAKRQYAEICDFVCGRMELDSGASEEDRVDALVAKVEQLKDDVGVPKSIQALGVKEAAFFAALDDMALGAFDDQSTGTNPRFPLIAELKTILSNAYYGKIVRMPAIHEAAMPTMTSSAPVEGFGAED